MVSTVGLSGFRRQVERHLFNPSQILIAKKEDELVIATGVYEEIALAA